MGMALQQEMLGLSCIPKSCPSKDGGSLVQDIFDAPSWETNGNNSLEAQDFLDRWGDIWGFLFRQTLSPCISLRVDLHDFVKSNLLDFLSMWAAQVSNAHNKVIRDSVQSSSHCFQTYRLDFF